MSSFERGVVTPAFGVLFHWTTSGNPSRWSLEPVQQAHGTTRHEAETRVKALSLRVIADRLEHGEAAPAGSRISFAVA